jgi:hypothetical protein
LLDLARTEMFDQFIVVDFFVGRVGEILDIDVEFELLFYGGVAG